MHIHKIIIKGLYGYINKEINFKKDITLLVGINGSGKTSILNLLSWMIQPSLPNMCMTAFKIIKLSFSFKEKDYVIECKHLKSTFKYSVSCLRSSEKFHPLIVRLHASPNQIPQDEDQKNNIFESYESLKPDKSEEKTWDFINSLPSPTIIGLDRNLYKDEVDRVFVEGVVKKVIRKRRQRIQASPLDGVKEVVNTAYRKSKNSILNLTKGLKNHLMLSTFEGSISLQTRRLSDKDKLTLSQIDMAEDSVKEYFAKFEKAAFTKDEQKIISKYFANLKAITNKHLKNPKDDVAELIFSLNSEQFKKLKKLIKEFERFELESKIILERINLYLETLNYFFKDSYKRLLFKEDTSELTFNIVGKDNNVLVKHNDINNLSSGEKQILILFSYLAFNSQDKRLFIIDEPELSLHIKWQEDFLSSLEKITPATTQIILATHSPILVGKKKENAILLEPCEE